MLGFAVTTGRLPCPATPTTASFTWWTPQTSSATWRTPQGGELTLYQAYQMVTGTMKAADGRTTSIEGRLRGTELTFTGYYPVVPWLAYLLAGMALGRLDLSRWSTTVRVGVVGAVAAVTAWGVSAALLEVPGVRSTLSDTFTGPGWQGSIGATLDDGLYGTTPTGSWWWLAVDSPHTATPFDLAHTIGTSLLVIALCVAAGRVAPGVARAGPDGLDGGNGSDLLRGHAGRDGLTGGAGDDALYGGRGGDWLTDWVATELDVTGPQDRDLLVGGHGNDFFGLADGADEVRAGPGDDLVKIDVDGTVDVIDCGPGRDRVLYYGPIEARDVLRGCERVVEIALGPRP